MSSATWHRNATFAAVIAAVAAAAFAQEQGGTRVDISGFAMLDMGYQANQNHPDWFDVVRPTKLPSFEDEFAPDGNWFAGVRQSRLGVRSFTPTQAGELRTIFEFELFGTGVDAGQTTFRLRHAWGELGKFGAGQTWSPFMDIDVFPNSIEYWGPNGMVFFRNVQLRYTPWQTDDGSRFVVALERPGASADQGDYADRIELQGVVAHFPAPDISAHYRRVQDWGHIQIAGILRQIEWEDTTPLPSDLSGDDLGWGINVSSNIKLGNNVLRLQVVHGEGIQNYMNDAPEDIGIVPNPGNPLQPLLGEALPMTGVVAFIDLNWSSKWTSTVGYSFLDIDNSEGQAANAFKKGQYALVNLLYHPTDNVMLGPELQWGDRENFRDGFSSDDVRVQFSAKYSFAGSVGGG
ncbi:MAG TPA: DcaP family trimeric outer membrane transporter [Gammaproteobacteria bacterium]